MTRKRALGRGLDALLKVEEEGLRTLPLDRLKPNRFQPRADFDEGRLLELADSIRSHGVVQPLVVTARNDGDYTIVAGERRWRAARRAGLAEVPVVLREVADDRDLLETALVENIQRADLNPVEEAEAYRKLQELAGLSQEELAIHVGKARTTISNALRLLKLPDEIQELLRAGRLTAGQARPLLSLKGEDQQLRLARRAADQGLSARALEAEAGGGQAKRKARSKTRKEQDADTAAAAERLTRRLQTKVEIKRKGRSGAVCVAFHNEEELMRLYDLFMQAGGGS